MVPPAPARAYTGVMRRPLSDSEVIGACVGAAAAMIAAGLLGAMRPAVTQANAGLVLVLIIIGAAVVGGRWAGGATALAAAVSFDFWLTRPYQSLAIKGGSDIVTTVLLFCVGIAVGHLARSRWEAEAGKQAGSEEVAGIFRVTRLGAAGAGLYEVIDVVEAEVAEVLHLRRCTFEVLPPEVPRPTLDPNGRIDAPYVHVGDGFALPREGIAIAVTHQGRTLGWLTGEPREELFGVSLDRRRTALVLAEQLGVALARSEADAA